MSDLFAVAGSKMFLGGALPTKITDFIASDFSGQTWVEVDGWSSCGQIGDTASTITTALINRGRDVKQKGTRNAGTWENSFANLPDDPGQIAMFAAEATRNNYAFKIEWASGEVWYFVGMVMSKSKSGGEANTIDARAFTVEVNSNIVEV